MSLAFKDLAPGFASPVSDAQETFRVLMNCFAYPAVPRPTPMHTAPVGCLNAVAASLLLCLADADTPIWLDAELRECDPVRSFIAFHSGSPVVEEPRLARFAFAASAHELPPFSEFAQGTPEYPDRSTTIVLQVRTFTQERMTFAGPGIASTSNLDFVPQLPEFPAQWAGNAALFPLGIDLVLASPSHMAALPRSVALREA